MGDFLRDRVPGELPEYGLLRRAQDDQVEILALGQNRLDRIAGLDRARGVARAWQLLLADLFVNETFDIDVTSGVDVQGRDRRARGVLFAQDRP